MALALNILVYLALAASLLAMVARFLKWATMPMHLRWELYPVAHEGKRASYGGSYLEENRWWAKPRQVSLLGELKVMIPEILFLECLWENNRKLWLRSFPFHFGLYLTIGGTLLLALNGLLAALAPSAWQGGGGAALRILVPVVLVAGLLLGFSGALGLLQRRMTDPALRALTTRLDLANLGLFVLAFGWALLTWGLADRDLSLAAAFMSGLLSVSPAALPDAGLPLVLSTGSVVLMSLLVSYIPLTHMSHFIGKYFAYHDIRWNDTPNLAGGPDEARIAALLERPVSWAAPHIRSGCQRTWAELAAEDMRKAK